MQDVTTRGKLLGRKTTGAGSPEEISFDNATTEMAATGLIRVKPGGIGNTQLADSSMMLKNLAQQVIDYIDASGGGTITNNPDGVTIKESISDELYVANNSVPEEFADGDTLPSVASASQSFRTANTTAKNIRNFKVVLEGRYWLQYFGDDNTSIIASDSLITPGQIDLKFLEGDMARFRKIDGVVRLESMQIF